MMQFGWTLIKWSFMALVIGAMPLTFILLTGPEDANPIGPGLLFFISSGFAALCIPSGVLILGIGWVRGESL